ncbi:phospholipase A [Chryseosolibacter indicus]|uniref:Phosphatidylcholine 1-acylhydrolase n=1 Tax=Chryseosolibacter indicus TaxID=2782351 RepID=A0ABS5VQN4_9BACT|nr:phospholipase A [Chryseosolibacter indicus]MBT1703656.1 phospholipase A [Chryseosolibacter indicus]
MPDYHAHTFKCFCIWICISTSSFTQAQNISEDSVNAILKNAPAFTIFQDNYFITGIPLNEEITRQSADVKFQISFKHRLTNAVLPFNTYLFLTYTQRSFWNVYESSSPFSESNYNPGLGLGRLIFNNHEFKGAGSVLIEHESNGRDSIYSRSINRVSFTYAQVLRQNLIITGQAWIPFSYSSNYLKYIGYGEVTINWRVLQEKLIFDMAARKGTEWDWKGSMRTQVSYRLGKKGNIYISMQWFKGYAENLLNFKQHTNMLRLGINLKPSKYFFY